VIPVPCDDLAGDHWTARTPVSTFPSVPLDYLIGQCGREVILLPHVLDLPPQDLGPCRPGP
jgi:hypothetical protein